jgi:HK97 family phage prohead protease
MSTAPVLDPDDVRMRLVGAEPGTIIGRFTVFDDIDHVGDRTKKGAFLPAIQRMEESGIKLPLLYNHAAEKDAKNLIGVVDELWETKSGGWFRARLDLGSEVASTLYRVIQLNPSAVGVSYGYSVPAGGEKKAADGANDLLRVDIVEVTLTPTPMLDTARVVGSKARSQTVAQQLLVSLEATAAITRTRSLDPVYDFDGLVKKLDNDVVYQWDSLVRKMSAKTSQTDTCCATSQTKRMKPVVKGGAPFEVCESCGMVTIIARKSWSTARIEAEYNRIASKITVVETTTRATDRDKARAKRMLDDLNKGIERAERRRAAADLAKFADAKPARPSKADVRRDVAELQAFVKTAKKSTNPETLFTAPPLTKEQLQ